MSAELVQQWWVWALAGIAFACAEVAMGTQLYLLALACACALVALGLGTDLLGTGALGHWQATVLVWCVAGLACATALSVLRKRMHGASPDPNAPLGRTAAVAGYEKENPDGMNR